MIPTDVPAIVVATASRSNVAVAALPMDTAPAPDVALMLVEPAVALIVVLVAPAIAIVEPLTLTRLSLPIVTSPPFVASVAMLMSPSASIDIRVRPVSPVTMLIDPVAVVVPKRPAAGIALPLSDQLGFCAPFGSTHSTSPVAVLKKTVVSVALGAFVQAKPPSVDDFMYRNDPFVP